MCTVLLPTDVSPIADKYVYHIIHKTKYMEMKQSMKGKVASYKNGHETGNQTVKKR
jgi:hypothetical protein